MPIDPKININENQVIFRKDRTGHNHDGLTSALIDTTKYSMFDFVVYPIAPVGTVRRNLQENNLIAFKTQVVAAVEERILNPAGIRIRPNTITATEIAASTITATELAANVILVNNIIKSNNYIAGSAGWAINGNGNAEFSGVTVRGTVVANAGAVGGINISASSIYSSDYDGSNGFAIYSNGFADFNEVSVRGEIIATSGSIADNFTIGNNLAIGNSATIGGFTNIGANISIGANASIGSSATIGGSLKIGDNVRINNATGDGGNTVLIVRGNTSTSANYCAKFEKLNGTDILNIRNDGAVTIAGSLSVNGSQVVTGGPYLTTASAANTYLSLSGGTIDGQTIVSFGSAGTTNTEPALRVNRFYTANGAYFMEFTNSGGAVRAGYIRYVLNSNNSIFYADTSDARLKEKVEKNVNAIDILNSIEPVTYKWKNRDVDVDFYGFFAQDLYKSIPQAVSPGDNEEVYLMDDGGVNVQESWGVDYGKIVPYLVKAVQELSDKNQELESRLQAIEGV